MAAPQWATDLVEQVCKDYNRAMPHKFNWRVSRKKRVTYSSGHMYPPYYERVRPMKYIKRNGRITVTAGHSVQDQELVLLHELAHWVTNRNKRRSHDRKFWDTAFELYERYGVDMDYAIEREKDYKVGAQLAYARRSK